MTYNNLVTLPMQVLAPLSSVTDLQYARASLAPPRHPPLITAGVPDRILPMNTGYTMTCLPAPPPTYNTSRTWALRVCASPSSSTTATRTLRPVTMLRRSTSRATSALLLPAPIVSATSTADPSVPLTLSIPVDGLAPGATIAWWSPSPDLSRPGAVLSPSTTSPVLTLALDALSPNTTYRVAVDVSGHQRAWAAFTTPPWNGAGALFVAPASGYALVTSFTLQASGWSHPARCYRFYIGAGPDRRPLNDGACSASATITTRLPLGSPGTCTVFLSADMVDTNGIVSQATDVVAVSSCPPSSTAVLQTAVASVDDLIAASSVLVDVVDRAGLVPLLPTPSPAMTSMQIASLSAALSSMGVQTPETRAAVRAIVSGTTAPLLPTTIADLTTAIGASDIGLLQDVGLRWAQAMLPGDCTACDRVVGGVQARRLGGEPFCPQLEAQCRVRFQQSVPAAAAAVVSVLVGDVHSVVAVTPNGTRVTNLPAPVVIAMPNPTGGAPGALECRWRATPALGWQVGGCDVRASGNATTCVCTHLTDFELVARGAVDPAQAAPMALFAACAILTAIFAIGLSVVARDAISRARVRSAFLTMTALITGKSLTRGTLLLIMLLGPVGAGAPLALQLLAGATQFLQFAIFAYFLALLFAVEDSFQQMSSGDLATATTRGPYYVSLDWYMGRGPRTAPVVGMSAARAVRGARGTV